MTLQDGRSAAQTPERTRCPDCGVSASHELLQAAGVPFPRPLVSCEFGAAAYSGPKRRLRGPARVIPAASSTIEPPPGVETSRTTGRTEAPGLAGGGPARACQDRGTSSADTDPGVSTLGAPRTPSRGVPALVPASGSEPEETSFPEVVPPQVRSRPPRTRAQRHAAADSAGVRP